jgi:hypothetical protein
MGKQRIKLRTKEAAVNFYAARPWTFSRWMKLKLVVLGWLGLAKKYSATETDPKTGVRTTLHGYAYKGSIYLTKQEVFTPAQAHVKDMEKALFGKKGPLP